MFPVTGVHRVADRLGRSTVCDEPRRGQSMQSRRLGGLLVGELAPQQLGEEPVVAVHRRVLGYRLDERVRPFQRREGVPCAPSPGQHLGELRREGVDDAGPQEEFADLGRLGGQHLADEVLGDVRVVPRDGGDQILGFAATLQRHGEQPEAGRPPLGALDERSERRIGQDDTVRGKQRRRFLGGERQVVSAHLAECPGQAVAVQRQRRIPTSHQDHPEVLVGVPQQRVEVFGQLPVVQDRNAVEDEDDGLGLGGQVGREPREHGTRDGAGAGRLVDRRGERDATAAEPLDEVRPEDGRLVVAFLEGYPHDGAGGVSGGHPRGDELGLATAGRPGHRCQGIADGLGDPVEEAASHHHERRGFGHGELRGVQRVAFGRRHTPGRGKNRQVARHVSLDRGYGGCRDQLRTWHRVPHRPHGVVDAEVRRSRTRSSGGPNKWSTTGPFLGHGPRLRDAALPPICGRGPGGAP